MTTKLLASFFYTWLGGGLLLQIPEVSNLIDPDRINSTVYNAILIITFLLWAFKYGLNLYERWRDIRHKKYPNNDKK